MTMESTNIKDNISQELSQASKGDIERSIKDFARTAYIEEQYKLSKNYALLSSTLYSGILLIVVALLAFNVLGQAGIIKDMVELSKSSVKDVADNSKKTIEDLRSAYEQTISSARNADYQLKATDGSKDTIKIKLAEKSNTVGNTKLYSLVLIVPLTIHTSGKAISEVYGISYRLEGSLVRLLSKENGRDDKVLQSILQNGGYYSSRGIVFSNEVPASFSFNLLGGESECDYYLKIKDELAKLDDKNKIYVKPILEKYSGHYADKDFVVVIDKESIRPGCP